MFNIKVPILLIGFVIGFVWMDPVPFDDCGSEYELEEVDIEGCKKLPCPLQMGKQQRIGMKLYSRSMSRDLVQSVEIVLRGVHTPMTVTPENPCTQINCPVSFNHNASFNAIMNVPNQGIIPLSGELLWKIHNEEGIQILCMETNISIKSKHSADDIVESIPPKN